MAATTEAPRIGADYKLVRGQALVLAGPKGCGKTSLARAIAASHGHYSEIDSEKLFKRSALRRALHSDPATLIVNELPLRKSNSTHKDCRISLKGGALIPIDLDDMVVSFIPPSSPDYFPELVEHVRHYITYGPELGDLPAYINKLEAIAKGTIAPPDAASTLNFIFCTDRVDAIPIDPRDRRFHVVHLPHPTSAAAR